MKKEPTVRRRKPTYRRWLKLHNACESGLLATGNKKFREAWYGYGRLDWLEWLLIRLNVPTDKIARIVGYLCTCDICCCPKGGRWLRTRQNRLWDLLPDELPWRGGCNG